MITPPNNLDLEDAVRLGYAMAAALHGTAGVIIGKVPLSKRDQSPYIGFDIGPAVSLADVQALFPKLTVPAQIAVNFPEDIERDLKQASAGSHVVAHILGNMLGGLYERIKDCDSEKHPHSHPTVEFLSHVRNAAFHGNVFDIWSKWNLSTATWRNRRIHVGLNGTTLFFDLLTAGDAILLFNDVLLALQPGIPNPLVMNHSFRALH
jgi:hypothetical protein